MTLSMDCRQESFTKDINIAFKAIKGIKVGGDYD